MKPTKKHEDMLNEGHLKRLKSDKKIERLTHGLIAGSGATIGAIFGASSGKHKIAKGVTGAALGAGLGHVVGKTINDRTLDDKIKEFENADRYTKKALRERDSRKSAVILLSEITYDKASWHIDQGENKNKVLEHFDFFLTWAHNKGILSGEGEKLYKEGLGSDPSISLHSGMFTQKGNKFMAEYYDDFIASNPKDEMKMNLKLSKLFSVNLSEEEYRLFTKINGREDRLHINSIFPGKGKPTQKQIDNDNWFFVTDKNYDFENACKKNNLKPKNVYFFENGKIGVDGENDYDTTLLFDGKQWKLAILDFER